MGIWSSKPTKHDVSLDGIRARKHCRLFVKGMDAALEGRYTESELYFHQLIFKHPKFLLHTKILVVLDQIMRRPPAPSNGLASTQNTTPPTQGTPSTRKSSTSRTSGEAEREEPLRASLDTIPIMEGANVTVTESTSGDTTLELPLSVGEDVQCLVDFLQLQQDIEHLYIACNTPRAHQLAMVYAQFNCIWMQLFVFFLSQLRLERSVSPQRERLFSSEHGSLQSPCSNQSGESRGKRFPRGQRKEAEALAYEELVDTYIELSEQLCLYFLISSVTNYGTLALQYAANLEKMQANRNSLSSTIEMDDGESRSAERSIKHKRQRIYDNVQDLCKMLINMISENAEDHSNEYISRVLFKVLPPWALRRSHHSRGCSLDASCGDNDRATRLRGSVANSATKSDCTGVRSPPQESPTNRLRARILGSPMSEADLSNQSDNVHLLSRMTKLFVAYAEGRGGGTFLAVSRTFSPLSPVALPLRTINLPFRLVVPTDVRVTEADLLHVGGPHCRVSWESTVWTLPSTARFSGHGFPLTSDFLLCNALPEFYEGLVTDAFVHGGGEAAVYAPKAVWRENAIPVQLRTNATTDAYIDSVLRYAEQQRNSGASDVTSGTYGGMSTVQNAHMDMGNARMRRAACMDETVTCMKLVYLLEARLLREAGRPDESRASAKAALQQTECLRGPTSRDALRIRQMLEEMELL